MTDSSSNDSKNYFKKYYETNKEDWNIKQDCNICGGHYTRNTRYHHFKSKKHILAEKDKKITELQIVIDKIKENCTKI